MENVIKLDHRKIKGQPVISSKEIAKAFGKEHYNVLKAIVQLEVDLALVNAPAVKSYDTNIIEKFILRRVLTKTISKKFYFQRFQHMYYVWVLREKKHSI